MNGTLERASGSGYGYRRTNTNFILITSLLLGIFYILYETEWKIEFFISGERICYDSHKHKWTSRSAVMPSAAFCSLGVSLAFSWVSVCTKSIVGYWNQQWGKLMVLTSRRLVPIGSYAWFPASGLLRKIRRCDLARGNFTWGLVLGFKSFSLSPSLCLSASCLPFRM